MKRQQDPRDEEFIILEEQGYDLEQFLCRCGSKNEPEELVYRKQGRSNLDPIAIVTVTLVDPEKLVPVFNKSINTNLGYIVEGLKNLDNFENILPEDPIAALYLILTNNYDEHGSRSDIEEFCKTCGLTLK